jgi:hypothetical protein
MYCEWLAYNMYLSSLFDTSNLWDVPRHRDTARSCFLQLVYRNVCACAHLHLGKHTSHLKYIYTENVGYV